MSPSQAVKDVLPKSYPFAKRGKVMIPQSKFNLGYHVTMMGKYSKKIPKREISALDVRNYESPMKFWNDTRKFNPQLYR